MTGPPRGWKLTHGEGTGVCLGAGAIVVDGVKHGVRAEPTTFHITVAPGDRFTTTTTLSLDRPPLVSHLFRVRAPESLMDITHLTCVSHFIHPDTGVPTPDHVVVVMEENHSYAQIMQDYASSATYIANLAAHGALMTNSYGVTHPSLPNYLAAISGSFQGIWDDCAAGATVTCPPEEFVPGSGDGTAGHYLTQAQIASPSAAVDAMYQGHGPITFRSEPCIGLARRYM